MQFLDNSGHIFTLKDYSQNPIGYEYDEQDYIFWFNDTNNNNQLSINNYYGKIINVLFEVDHISDLENITISNIYDIDLTLESEIFSMIKANQFQNALHQTKSILDNVIISESKDKYQKLVSTNDDDILVIKVSNEGKNYIMIPIYLIANSKYVGSWMSNILIHITNKYSNKEVWCPITIGGIFNGEYEALTINGKNMGVNLPKEILRAINGTQFDHIVFDEELYNKKIKEYMINYMGIKGECGNYDSADKSLKWFGWGKYLELYKLIENDNEFKTQYIRDFFRIDTDIIQAYKFFINTQFIGLKFQLNTEVRDENNNIVNYPQNINKQNHFWGEGLPILKDLTNLETEVSTDEYLEDQRFKYQSMYFKYSLYDLMFKLSCLAYYYQTYFLPIFITLKNLNIEYKVYANNYKLLTYTHDHYYESIINIQNQKYDVIFPEEDFLYFTHQKHYVDETYNDYTCNSIKPKYIINDTCIYIPIIFPKDIYCNCILILKDNQLNQVIYQSKFAFINNDKYNYNGFVFYPKMIEELLNTQLYTFVNKSYTLYINLNNNWYEYSFISKIHELDVHLGTLEYKYWINDINYCNYIYHLYDERDENNNIIFGEDKLPINNTSVIFNFFNQEDNSIDTQLDITNYISTQDFFDSPTKYFSNFSQIDYIDDKVHFNSYMNEPDFIHVNGIEFGLYQKKINNYINHLDNNSDESVEQKISEYIKNNISELVNKYQENINIVNNYKYLNNIHLYNLYHNEYSIKDENGNIKDLLRFKNNLRALCDNLVIERTNLLNNTFRVSYLNKISKITNTKDDYNYYLNEEFKYLNDRIQLSLKEDSVWYFILERDENGKIQVETNSEENIPKKASSLYTIKENKNQKVNIGSFIYQIEYNENRNMFVDFEKTPISTTMENGFNYKNVKYNPTNNILYYDIEDYQYPLYFNFTPLIKYKDRNKYIPYSIETWETIQSDERNSRYENKLYAKIDLHYYEIIKILNLYGYYSESWISDTKQFCENFELSNNGQTATCTLNYLESDGQTITTYKNVKLERSSKFINYYDLQNLIEENNNSLNQNTRFNLPNQISNDNPSLYWATYDKETQTLIDNINGNNLYHYSELENIDFENDDNYTFKYINYFCKDITGLKGKFLPCCEFFGNSDKRNKFIICVDIIDKDNNHLEIKEFDNIILNSNPNYNTYNLLELQGNEKQVLLYFKINTENDFNTFTVCPHLYEYYLIPKPIEYHEEDDLVSLYKDFFYKRYSVTLINNNEENTIKEIWDSYIHITQDEDYDMYLMHGPEEIGQPEYWYIMFISKNTCNSYDKLINLNNCPKEIVFNDYVLKHVSTKQLFLINRMKVNYKENIYHFNQDDIIVCSLYNNKMLPVNMNLSSKWNITPISYGANTTTKVCANTNTAIISINTTNIYDKGYYDLTVNYSLDNNVLNTQKINKRILIK